MATVTHGIGTARDYSTISSWAADHDNGAVFSASDDAVGEVYDDFVYNEDIDLDGGGTLGLTSVTMTVPSAERHDGTAGTGARNVRSAGSANVLLYRVDGVDKTIEWIEITRSNTLAVGLINRENVTAVTTLHFLNMIVHGLENTGSASPYLFQSTSVTGGTINICNCIFYDLYHNNTTNTKLQGVIVQDGSSIGANSNIVNNTIHDIEKNGGTADVACIAVADDSDLTLKNNLVTDPSTSGSGSTECFDQTSFSNTDCDYNASSDATSSGANSLSNITTADQYVSIVGGSEDLHLKSGADAINEGLDLGSTPAGVEFDIDGRDRDANGDVWDIGADEFVSAASGTILPASRRKHRHLLAM